MLQHCPARRWTASGGRNRPCKPVVSHVMWRSSRHPKYATLVNASVKWRCATEVHVAPRTVLEL